MGKKRGTKYTDGGGALAFEAIASGDKDFIVSAPNRKTSETPVQRRWIDENGGKKGRVGGCAAG